MNFTAIDFETANGNRASACSIGWVRVENGEFVEEGHQFLRPSPLWFDPFNIAIHGITEADVRGAPSFAEFLPVFRERARGPLVAHNASFDMSVLRGTLDDAGVAYPETDYFCTKVIARRVWPGRDSYALHRLAEVEGIRFRHHDALEDARVCARIILAACRDAGVETIYALPAHCGLRVGRLFAGGYSPCGAEKRRRSRT